jgi:serine/threonine protein kinase
MLILDDIILNDFGPNHIQFRNLLQFMLRIDPNERPSASDCLKHPFFGIREFSKSTEKTLVSTDHRQSESPLRTLERIQQINS